MWQKCQTIRVPSIRKTTISLSYVCTHVCSISTTSLTYADFLAFHRYVTVCTTVMAVRCIAGTLCEHSLIDSLNFGSSALGFRHLEYSPPHFTTRTAPWVYGCDGKWLGRAGVFFIHRNVTTKENLFWSFMSSESYEAIHRDLAALTTLLGDHLPMGAVSDWKGAIVAGVASHFGNIPHQRCLAHVDRQAKRLLPSNSPFAAAQALRRVASLLALIETNGYKDMGGCINPMGKTIWIYADRKSSSTHRNIKIVVVYPWKSSSGMATP